MQITESVNKIARGKIDNLRDHHREQRVRSDVKWHTEEKIGTSLVELAARSPSCT